MAIQMTAMTSWATEFGVKPTTLSNHHRPRPRSRAQEEALQKLLDYVQGGPVTTSLIVASPRHDRGDWNDGHQAEARRIDLPIATSKGPDIAWCWTWPRRVSPVSSGLRTFETLSKARSHITNRQGLQAGRVVWTTTRYPTGSRRWEDLSRRLAGVSRDIRPVTVEGYRNVLAPVMRKIGSKKVQYCRSPMWKDLTDWLSREGGKRGQPLGPRSVKASLVALAQALDLAAREDAVTRNVARLARRPRIRTVAGTDLTHWQPDEAIDFREHADADPLAAAWRLTLCGMTRAESSACAGRTLTSAKALLVCRRAGWR